MSFSIEIITLEREVINLINWILQMIYHLLKLYKYISFSVGVDNMIFYCTSENIENEKQRV